MGIFGNIFGQRVPEKVEPAEPSPPPPWTEEIGIAEGLRPFEAKAIAIAFESLRNNPDEWTFSHHTANNKTLGLSIWMSNRYYGTHVEIASVIKVENKIDREEYSWGRELVSLADDVGLAKFVKHYEQHKLQIAANKPFEVNFEPTEKE